jgi:hypothetical protein
MWKLHLQGSRKSRFPTFIIEISLPEWLVSPEPGAHPQLIILQALQRQRKIAIINYDNVSVLQIL